MDEVLQDVRVERPGAWVAVAVFSGEHDLGTRDGVRDLLASLVDVNEVVVADFSTAVFVDSALLHALLATHARAKARGSSFSLQLAEDAIVRRAFDVCGVLEEIAWAPTRELALNGDGSRGRVMTEPDTSGESHAACA